MIWTDVITTTASVITAAVAIWIFVYSRRQTRFDIMEQSFDTLQRINEKALESDENCIAAFHSINPTDTIGVEDARLIYFKYMRLNRIFRAYEYNRGGFLSNRQMNRIITPQLRTLVIDSENLPKMLERGYPEDFSDFLQKKLKTANAATSITIIGADE